MTVENLTTWLRTSAVDHASRLAIVGADGRVLTYAELDERSGALAAYLAAHGVRRGDRVGVVSSKTVDAVVALFGTMKAGAAYVPIDVNAPAERGRAILSDCQVRAVIADNRGMAMVPSPGPSGPLIIGLGDAVGTGRPAISLDAALAQRHPRPDIEPGLDDLAYILYTSGSTGTPKGVMLTHQNAVNFVDWCSSVFEPTPADRFSSHAPFHFDLSVLDLYVSVKHGATLFLIPDALGKSPKDLAHFIAANRLTIWYSTPSILTLLLQFGRLEEHDCSSLRTVLFAGEVFPVKHLRELKRRWPAPAYYNLYGPTETNVCTFARIPDEIPENRTVPYPIGFACSHCEARVMDDEGHDVTPGSEGLLYISGPSVFSGYWNRPEQNARVFLTRDQKRWYNTGDVVRWDPDDGFLYAGRRDRMVKRRGYRIELGEIERALYLHADVREAAVVSVDDEDAGVRIVAYLACAPGTQPSIVDLKAFCATRIPAYMSPDRFLFVEQLPKTTTDKVDYQTLKERSRNAPALAG